MIDETEAINVFVKKALNEIIRLLEKGQKLTVSANIIKDKTKRRKK